MQKNRQDRKTKREHKLRENNPEYAAELATFSYPQAWQPEMKEYYGNSHDLFSRRALRCVHTGVEKLRKLQEQGALTEKVFFEQLDEIAAERRSTAEETKSTDAKLFGVARSKRNIETHTKLVGVRYDETGKVIRDRMANLIEKHLLGTNDGFANIIMGDSRYEVVILSGTDPVVVNAFNDPHNFTTRALHSAMKEFSLWKSIHNIRISGYIVGQTYLTIDGKEYPLTTHYSHYYSFKPDNTIGPEEIQYIREHSIVLLEHTDPTIADVLLKSAAKVWLKALQWDEKKDDLQQLKAYVGEIIWKLGQATRWARGSAAIAEIERKIVYVFQYFVLKRLKANIVLDLEILKNPFMSLFIAQYVQGRFWDDDQDPTASRKKTELPLASVLTKEVKEPEPEQKILKNPYAPLYSTDAKTTTQMPVVPDKNTTEVLPSSRESVPNPSIIKLP